MPDLALVIVNYRTPAATAEAASSVVATAGRDVRVVIVDNASGDGSVERLRAELPAAEVLARADNGGFAAGVNAGMAAAGDADAVLVLNPDAEVQPGALPALEEALDADPAVAVAGPLLLHEDGSPREEAYRAWPSLWSLFVSLCLPVGHLLLRLGRHPEVHPVAVLASGPRVARVCGSAMLIRRAAWDAVGPMDEGFFLYFEEVEWQRRVVDAGWSVRFVPEARVTHLVQGGEPADTVPLPYLVSAFRYQRGRGHSSRAIGAVVLAAIAISIATLTVAAAVPRWRAKAVRMRASYRELAAVARREAR